MIVLFNMEPEERAALFLVPEDKAVIYFFRDETSDDALPLALSIDGNTAGETRPTRFQFYEVAPGRHTLMSPGALSDSIGLDAEAGKTYFVGQEVGCNEWPLRIHLHAVDPAAGRARVRALYLAGKAGASDEAIVAANSLACRSAGQSKSASSSDFPVT